MSVVVRFPAGFVPVLKHGDHDQSSHGRRGGVTSQHQDNGWGVNQLMNATSRTDPYQGKVYKAEKVLDKDNGTGEAPVAPKRDDFATYDEYSSAYDQYSKDYDEWATATTKNVTSDIAVKHLDGSPAGVRNYVDEVIKSEWFQQEFGSGTGLPPLQVKVRSLTSIAGKHELGVRNGKQINNLVISRQRTMDETTILHEIAHYADAITVTGTWEGHGVSFAKKHLTIVERVLGTDAAEKLKASYLIEGVPVED